MSARLTADFWVAAYRARAEAAGIAVYIAAKGDPTAGAVAVKLATMDGAATLYERMPDLHGGRRWEAVAQGPEADIDARLARRRARDPDLWIVEIEDRHGRTLLDEEGMEG